MSVFPGRRREKFPGKLGALPTNKSAVRSCRRSLLDTQSISSRPVTGGMHGVGRDSASGKGGFSRGDNFRGKKRRTLLFLDLRERSLPLSSFNADGYIALLPPTLGDNDGTQTDICLLFSDKTEPLYTHHIVGKISIIRCRHINIAERISLARASNKYQRIG